MTFVRVQIDAKRIREKLMRAAEMSPAAQRIGYNKVYGLYTRAKRMMLKEFDRHPVTAEIRGGPRAINLSGTLDGYGNLFSFIGFEQGSNPIADLRDLMEQGTFMEQTTIRRGIMYFRIHLPSTQAIENATPMPWEGGDSWATGIEKGISGLSHYMFKRWEKSRSGYGLQLPYENLEDVEFQRTPYLSVILRDFRARVNNSKINDA